jgi:hypothetical protein
MQQFGSAQHRSGSGALLSGEVERIKGFLRNRGLLLAEGLGGWLVVVHPAVAAEAERPLLDAGLRRVVLGASIEGIRGVADLTVAETRALEVLSPGPLIVAKGNGDESEATLIAVPDSDDLRAIGSALGGTATAFLQTGASARAHVEDIVSGGPDDDPAHRLGVLEPSAERRNAPELPTVVRISGPRTVECLAEGALTVDAVTAASDVVSQWEIEDWT